jgi:hypothetical protein
VIIDCDSCRMRGVGCSDCVVSVLLDAPETVEFDEPELRAIDALADAGLVPRLRLLPIHIDQRERDTPGGCRPCAERPESPDGRPERQVG